ncbi:MAG: SDR family NAD(P)-dependent oxidoreductase [Phycisphaerales bacterium]
MAVDLRGKPIAITGAGTGIGAATALACARVGMPVALCGRRADKLESIAGEIRSAGGRAITVAMDVSDAAACRAFIQRTVAEFGSIYSVYANAGWGYEKPIHAMSDEEMRSIFETNFFGTMNVIRPALEHMLRNSGTPRGHILICSSCLSKMAIPHYGAYSATKAAQNHVGRAMRLELEPLGVQVSTVHPITTRTELFDKVRERSGIEQVSPHAPAFFTQDADVVADKTIACLRRPKPEVWTGFKGAVVRFGMSINTLFPRLADFTVRGLAKQRNGQAISAPTPAENGSSVRVANGATPAPAQRAGASSTTA